MAESNQPPENGKVEISMDDFEAFVRDTLYAYELDGSGILTLSHAQVVPLAASIARRAIIGR